MKRLSYLATFAIFALLLVPTAWAQTQDQDQSQGQGVVAVPVPEARSIDIRDNRFEPVDATVAPGSTLMWINYDQAQHTVTADDGQFDSGVLDPGDIFVVTVEGSGRLTYRCTLHPEMKGSVTVGEGGEAGEVITEEATTEEKNPALDPPTGEAPPAEEASIEGTSPTEETSAQEAPVADETSTPEGSVA
ncbi:MAG TPA: cupredoxin domain-containing protein [Rubrobacteraceae bacterium]|nr:cupredoxin domain-containing protein [Rubrobacteraceae bacterium]